MFNTASIVTLLILTVWSNECLCDICKVCECVNTDSGLVARCRGKFADVSFNYELITLDERQPLHKLILTENLGAELLTSQIQKKMKYLRQLDLSGNQLENVHEATFHELPNLEDLSYSDNRLSGFDISILNANSALLRLNLSHNEINTLERNSQSTLPSLKVFDLSHNNLTDLRDFLEAVPRLEHLDLSSNSLSDLKAASLAHLQYLKNLHISDNRLLSLNFMHLPLRLEELHAENNLISILKVPKKIFIQVLNLGNNRITDLKGEELMLLEELRHLNVSENSLSGFPPVTLTHVKSLDLSFNNLTTIPESISTTYFPALRVLKVSGNRLRDLMLQSELKLEAFEASHMDTIEEIHEDTFRKLLPRENGCINVTVSNCKLRTIAEDAFRYMNVCSLDLSNNRFAQFPSKLINDNRNKNANYLVNLQGNPLVCNCSLQWMLNELIPYLYRMQPGLLEELRCAKPPVFANLRLVHWYRWGNKEFCNAPSEKLIFNFAKMSTQQKTTFNSSSGMIIALGITATIFAILMIIGIMLTRKVVLKKRRANRRF